MTRLVGVLIVGDKRVHRPTTMTPNERGNIGRVVIRSRQKRHQRKMPCQAWRDLRENGRTREWPKGTIDLNKGSCPIDVSDRMPRPQKLRRSNRCC